MGSDGVRDKNGIVEERKLKLVDGYLACHNTIISTLDFLIKRFFKNKAKGNILMSERLKN